MRVEINLSNLKYKLLISIVVLCLFFVIYSSLPHNEFGRSDKTINEISNYERFIFTIERHLLFSTRNSLYPITSRGEILSLSHAIIAWCILII